VGIPNVGKKAEPKIKLRVDVFERLLRITSQNRVDLLARLTYADTSLASAFKEGVPASTARKLVDQIADFVRINITYREIYDMASLGGQPTDYTYLDELAGTNRPSKVSQNELVLPEQWRGDLQIAIRSAALQNASIGLDYPGVLPLQANDGYTLTISLNRTGFAYAFLIRPDGVLNPIYPHCTPGDWGSRPAIERPLTGQSPFIFEPKIDKKPWWKIPAGPPGMLTFLLLASPAQLAADVNFERLIGPIDPQVEELHRATLWFENGLVLRNRIERDLDFEAVEIADPIFDLQRRIRTHLIGDGKPFCYSLSVSFATNGRTRS